MTAGAPFWHHPSAAPGARTLPWIEQVCEMGRSQWCPLNVCVGSAVRVCCSGSRWLVPLAVNSEITDPGLLDPGSDGTGAWIQALCLFSGDQGGMDQRQHKSYRSASG